MPNFRNVAIVGVGLIGGSIGLALRKRGLAVKVTGVGRKKSSLDKALGVGAIDLATTDLAAGVADAEIVIVATPVDIIAEYVCHTASAAPNVQLITDAGSTKGQICSAIDAGLAGKANPYVGSHPLAGDHRTGPEYSRDDLLDGKTVVITPTKNTSAKVLENGREFWQSLGAVVCVMSPQEHDEALATTSHLPHLAASALAKCTPQEYLQLSATGWADTTRVAAGDAELWTQIFHQNSAAMIPAVDKLISQLAEMRTQMAMGEWTRLQDTLQEAKLIRDALGN
ncbi:MAG: prephenate dehydrogenase/arogenate dehydrogenase family protein [Pirellulales bacterium]|nr:prephenate dehydrogenase/arogenate dehydrogenase family protein [Pirellulales bacterium]